jgi:integrase
MKYRFEGREKSLFFGVCPEVTLAEAMERLNKARRQLRDDLDPAAEKKKSKLKRLAESENTFETVARQWIKRKSQKWAPRHAERVTRSLEADLFPVIGNIAMNEIDTLILRSCLDPIQNRGALYIASRVRQRCEQVFEYGQALGVCTRNPLHR